MITSDEQISPPSLVCKENSLHLHSFCVDILFKFTALGHSFMQNFATLQFKTRLGGEICSLDVNMHKGYSSFGKIGAAVQAYFGWAKPYSCSFPGSRHL